MPPKKQDLGAFQKLGKKPFFPQNFQKSMGPMGLMAAIFLGLARPGPTFAGRPSPASSIQESPSPQKAKPVTTQQGAVNLQPLAPSQPSILPLNLPKMTSLSMRDDTRSTLDAQPPLVNPAAPKGGVLKIVHLGPAFDSFNPVVVMAQTAPGIELVADPLAMRDPGRPFTMHGLIAQSFQIPQDRSFLIVHIHPKALFADGRPITAQDVIFSFRQSGLHGVAARREAARQVRRMIALDDRTVRFDFAPTAMGHYDRELPLLILLTRVFAEHSLPKDIPFEQSGLRPLITSGPYEIASHNQGRSIVYKRRPDYWAKDLPIVQGLYNPDKIQISVYQSPEMADQAVARGESDFAQESSCQKWQDFWKKLPAVQTGQLILQATKHRHPVGMYGIAMNTDSLRLKDIGVRRAIQLLVSSDDLKALMGDNDKVTLGFFDNTSFQAPAEPSQAEQALNKELPSPLTDTALPASSHTLPASRRRLEALRLLTAAGFSLKNGKMMDADGRPFVLTFLVPDTQKERVAEAVSRALAKVGISVAIQRLEPLLYQKKIQDAAYDLMICTWMHSLSPGVEQSVYYHSAAVTNPNHRNYARLKNPNVDFICQRISTQPTQEGLETHMQLLDRLLRRECAVIPLYHKTTDYRIFSNRVGHPPFPQLSPYSPPPWSFWIKGQ
jgi:ABC-type oligopeptide transport system substrate-binding subunit